MKKPTHSLLHRCTQCGTVMSHRVNHPGGLCDNCNDKAGPAYLPNGGNYYDSRLNSFALPTVHPPEPFKKICWKCHYNEVAADDEIGICKECAGDMKGIATASLLLVTYLLICIIQVPLFVRFGWIEHTYTSNIIFQGFAGVLLVALDAALLGGLFLAGLALYAAGWGVVETLKLIAPFIKIIRLYITKSRKQLHQEAIERGKLADPQILSGQQLDALLTEEYKKKQGWNE